MFLSSGNERKCHTSFGVLWVPPGFALDRVSRPLHPGSARQNSKYRTVLSATLFLVGLALALFFFLFSDFVDLYIQKQSKFPEMMIKGSGAGSPSSSSRQLAVILGSRVPVHTKLCHLLGDEAHSMKFQELNELCANIQSNVWHILGAQ